MSSRAAAEGAIQRVTKTKKVDVPLPVCPTRSVEAKTDDSTFLAKEFAVVSVICPGVQIQMTLHRPVGYTNLDDDEWVLSPSEATSILHSRKDHPKAGLHATERRRAMLLAYSASDTPSMYDVNEESLSITYHGYDRNVLVRDARKASRAQWIVDHPPTEGDIKKGLTASEKEPSLNYVSFLKDPDVAVEQTEGETDGRTRVWAKQAKTDPGFLQFFPGAPTASAKERRQKLAEYNSTATVRSAPRGNAELQSCEQLYLEFIKDKVRIKAAHDQVIEEPYETKSGQPAQFPQRPCRALKGLSKEQASDTLMQLIARVSTQEP